MPKDPKVEPQKTAKTPKKKPDPVAESLRALSMRAAVDALAFKSRIQSLRDGFDGTVLQGTEGSGVSRSSRRRPGEVLYEAVKLQLQIANEVLNFGQSQADFWLDRVQRMGVAALPRDQRPGLRLTASARVGDEATWRLFVFNASHEPRVVELSGRWKRGDFDGNPPGWRATLTPSPFVVPPQAERELVFHHAVDAALAPGKTYRAKVKVQMRGGKKSDTPTQDVGRLELELTVTE
jgi:hypothetical protein